MTSVHANIQDGTTILAQACTPTRKGMQQSVHLMDNDHHHHCHRRSTMTRTKIDNDNGDKDDKEKDDKTTSPFIPSEHLRTQRSEDPKIFHRMSKNCARRRFWIFSTFVDTFLTFGDDQKRPQIACAGDSGHLFSTFFGHVFFDIWLRLLRFLVGLSKDFAPFNPCR